MLLVGRSGERERVERLIEGARHGRSGVLVVRDEAGIGKTALLRYALDLAEPMTVARAAGVESEAELDFSACWTSADRSSSGSKRCRRTRPTSSETRPVSQKAARPSGSRSTPRSWRFSRPPPNSARCSSSSTTPTGSTRRPPTHSALPRAGWSRIRVAVLLAVRSGEAAQLRRRRVRRPRVPGAHGRGRATPWADAIHGDESSFRARSEEALAQLDAAGMRLAAEQVRCSRGLLELGSGRLEEAAATFTEASRRKAEMAVVDSDLMPDADLVETLVHLGRPDEASVAFDAWTSKGTSLEHGAANASAARCRGLLANEGSFAAAFAEAIDLHAALEDAFGEARTRLCLGERLRRKGLRVEARRELNEALATFERLQAAPWVERPGRSCAPAASACASGSTTVTS